LGFGLKACEMEKSNEELLKELKDLQQKYQELEKKFTGETDRLKKNEEDLRLRLLFLEGVANSAIDGFLVVNPYGQKILQNQRTIELWKIPQEVVDDPSGIKQVNHVMHMTVNPQQFVAEIDYLREHPNDKSRDELELIDGTVLDRYSSAVIGPDGKNYGRIWTFHDITERKKFEKQLVQLNTDKDRFISILAHDLRNPFSSLLGFSELLQKNLSVYPMEKTSKIVETIYEIAIKTHELLEDTLLWANTQSKNITFNPIPVSIFNVIAEVVDILEPGAKAKGIAIKYIHGDEFQVNADIYMLKAILRNLVSNAIKFTNEGGIIKISAAKTTSGTTISVADNGVGIEPEILSKLFNVSSIQSSKGTLNETGTGLGLLLCKEFIERHNGKIWIESEVQKGTKVNIILPNK
jgi:signal transduction histidine kinase